MSSLSHNKILGILILLIVTLASAESFVIWNRSTGQNTTRPSSTSLMENTGSSTSLQTTGTSVASWPPIEWITIRKPQPLNYYLTTLESNGTQPYVLLGMELGSLPNLTNATAVATITYLALNASNPEVKDAFQLLVIGGAPSYNTELEALYWLATRNQFKKDDTTALAIAIVDGFYITIGDDQTRNQVRTDDDVMLNAAREISEWQKQIGMPYNLENYPLIAKLCWAWRGGMSPNVPTRTQFTLTSNKYQTQRLDLFGYKWMTSDPSKMSEKRSWLINNGLVKDSIADTEQAIERYLYFPRGPHWIYSNGNQNPPIVVINGVTVPGSWGINNPDFEFENLVTRGYGIGNCRDEAITADTLLKSIGIASDFMENTVAYDSHTFAIFFDPARNVWTVSEDQIDVELEFAGKDLFYVFVPPFDQHGYLNAWAVNQPQPDLFAGNQYYMKFFDSFQTVRDMLTAGMLSTTLNTYFSERNDQ